MKILVAFTLMLLPCVVYGQELRPADIAGDTEAIDDQYAKDEKSLFTQKEPSQIEKVILEGKSNLAVLDESAPVKVVLTYRDAVEYAIEHNLQIKAATISPREAAGRLLAAYSEFDSFFTAQMHKRRAKRPFLPRDRENYTYTTGNDYTIELQKKFETATRIAVGVDGTRSTNKLFPHSATNPTYNASTYATFTQNLLRGFGIDIQNASIDIATNNRSASLQQLRQTINATLYQTSRAYWELVYARQYLLVQEDQLRRAIDLRERNKIQVQTGTLPPLDVLEAEVSVVSQEERMLTAMSNVKKAEDDLKRLVFSSQKSILEDARLIPIEMPTAADPPLLNLEECIRIAMLKRPELTIKNYELINNGINLNVAKNNYLPTLDLTGRIAENGVGTSDGQARNGKSGRYTSYEIGLEFRYPLENRGARGAIAEARYKNARLLAEMMDSERGIIAEVKDAVRSVEVNLKRVAATETARVFSQERLRAEEKKFSVGRSTSWDVLRYQADLSTAEGNALRTKIDYVESLVKLDQVLGILHEKENIRITDEDGTAIPYFNVLDSVGTGADRSRLHAASGALNEYRDDDERTTEPATGKIPPEPSAPAPDDALPERVSGAHDDAEAP